MASTSTYSFGFTGRSAQLFSKKCTREGGIPCTKKQGGGLVCTNCFDVRMKSGRRLRQTVKERGATFQRALELMKKDEISPNDAKFLMDFSRSSNSTLSEKGQSLKNIFCCKSVTTMKQRPPCL